MIYRVDSWYRLQRLMRLYVFLYLTKIFNFLFNKERVKTYIMENSIKARSLNISKGKIQKNT